MVLKAALNVRAVRRAFLVSFLLGLLTSIVIADVVTVSVEPSRTTGMAPLPVFFDATGTKLGAGDLRSARFCWDFGDPLSAHPTATGFNVGHVYDKPGIYTVTVTVMTETTGARRPSRSRHPSMPCSSSHRSSNAAHLRSGSCSSGAILSSAKRRR